MASITLDTKNLIITSDRSARPIISHIKASIIVTYTGTTWANGTVKVMINGHPFVFSGDWNRSLLGPLDLVGATDTTGFTPSQTATAIGTLIKNI
jgi:hypothetical protein